MPETREQCNARIDSAHDKLDTLNSVSASFITGFVAWVSKAPIIGGIAGTLAKAELDDVGDDYADKMRESQCGPEPDPSSDSPADTPSATSEPGASEGSSEQSDDPAASGAGEAGLPEFDPSAPLGSPENPIDLDVLGDDYSGNLDETLGSDINPIDMDALDSIDPPDSGSSGPDPDFEM